MDRSPMIGWDGDSLPNNNAQGDSTVSIGTVPTPTFEQYQSTNAHPFPTNPPPNGRNNAAGRGAAQGNWQATPSLSIPAMQSRPPSTAPPAVDGTSGGAQLNTTSNTTSNAQPVQEPPAKKRRTAGGTPRQPRTSAAAATTAAVTSGARNANASQPSGSQTNNIPSPAPSANGPSPLLATPSSAIPQTGALPRTPHMWHNNGSPATNGGTPNVIAHMAPGPEGHFRSFEELLVAVQEVAEVQGYKVVKLRSSNYREGRPTRFDLVCDRGGVKYSSTSKNSKAPSTRKIDCPWKGKAVCEVSSNNQWRFIVQEPTHNHEPRATAAEAALELDPVVITQRKLDRLLHDMSQGFAHQMEMINKHSEAMMGHLNNMTARIIHMEQRLDAWESKGGPSDGVRPPVANGRTINLGNRINNIEARMSAIEAPQNLDMQMDDEDAEGSELLGDSVL